MTRTGPRFDETPPLLSDIAMLALWALWERSDYPYSVRRRITPHLPGEEQVKVGTFYALVARLESDGLLAQAGHSRDGHLPSRTYYEITERGRSLYHREVWRRFSPTSWYDPARAWLPLTVTLAGVMGPAGLRSGLQRRDAELRRAIPMLEFELRRAVAEGTWHEFLDCEVEVALRRAEQQWCEEMIARLGDSTRWQDVDQISP